MYERLEETDNHLPRSSIALRFPVTRKKCVAPPRHRGCKVKPSLPRLKKERRREKYFRKLHGDMHTKCSEELQSRQKYRNRLVSELSVPVTCSRVPFLDPVLVKPRSGTTVSLKCIQSQNLSPNTSQPRSIQWKPIKIGRPCTHARPATPPAVHAEAYRVAATFPTFSKRMEFADVTVGRNDVGQPKCIQPEWDHLHLPTVLPRTVKVHHPSAKLCRAWACENRPDNERNSTTFADSLNRQIC